MHLKILAFSALLAAAGIAAAPAAQAQYGYRNDRGYYGRGDSEHRRREILRDRLENLSQRIRLAEREGEITRNKASHLFEELNDVRRFLRDDRNLTDDEFDRRMDDLNDVQEEFRRALRNQGRWGRYSGGSDYGRYDRYDRGRYDYGRYDNGRYDTGRYDYGYRRDNRCTHAAAAYCDHCDPDHRYRGRTDRRYDDRYDRR